MSNPANGPNIRTEVVKPRIIPGNRVAESFCRFVMASSDNRSTISKPKHTEARKNTRKGISFGLMKACPHRSGCQENNAETASAAGDFIQRNAKRYRK